MGRKLKTLEFWSAENLKQFKALKFKSVAFLKCLMPLNLKKV